MISGSILWVIPVAVVPLAAAAFLLFICYSRRLKRQRKGTIGGNSCLGINATSMKFIANNVTGSRRQGKNSEFSLFDFEQLLEATSNFSEENILGQGGFGTVYKVNLAD